MARKACHKLKLDFCTFDFKAMKVYWAIEGATTDSTAPVMRTEGMYGNNNFVWHWLKGEDPALHPFPARYQNVIETAYQTWLATLIVGKK